MKQNTESQTDKLNFQTISEYKRLLKVYSDHVEWCEGINFLENLGKKEYDLIKIRNIINE